MSKTEYFFIRKALKCSIIIYLDKYCRNLFENMAGGGGGGGVAIRGMPNKQGDTSAMMKGDTSAMKKDDTSCTTKSNTSAMMKGDTSAMMTAQVRGKTT